MRSFWIKIDALEAWHAKLVDKPWLQPLKPTKFIIALFLLSTVIAAGMNWYVRHWQYQVWEQNPQIFYLDDGTPLFTTTDAPYFLGLAKAIKEKGNSQAFHRLRLYSEAKQTKKDVKASSSLRDVPLLPIILASQSADVSQKSLLEAGNRLIPITATLTAMMIVFAFGAAGYWLAGAVAAAGGGLSFAYLTRSGAGRIDTDQLNLGFFYLITGLIIFAARARSLRWCCGLTGLAGISFWIFDWWYSKPVFGWAFFVGLCWMSLVSHRDIKRTSLQAFIFVMSSGFILMDSWIDTENAYFLSVLDSGGLTFPNTFSTITELRQIELAEILSRISGSVWLGAVSVIGLGFWGLRHPALAIVFGPAAAFALLNFFIGNRAIFYSAPMLWFGFGWSLITIAKMASEKVQHVQTRNAAVLLSTLAGFVAVWFASPTSYVQGPTFDKRVVRSFADMEQAITYDNAVIATWWDYGYMSMFMNQMPTLHDGGSQTSPTTYFIANSLLSTSQELTADRLQQLKRVGSEGVIRSLVGQDQTEQNGWPDRTLYLVLTKDMANWISSISKIGNWDIINGKPKVLTGVPSNYQLTYENLSCEAANQANRFICNGIPIDTATGQVGSQAILDGMVVSRDGRQLSGQKFNNSTSALVLHSEIGERGRGNMLIHRDLYFSVFHQLFHAGRHDERHFELVYDDYPSVRVFKVK